jgi:hypothetical protein
MAECTAAGVMDVVSCGFQTTMCIDAQHRHLLLKMVALHEYISSSQTNPSALQY